MTEEKIVVENKAEEKATLTMIMETRMKEYIKLAGMHSTSDMADAVNAQVAIILDGAIRRCKANNRSTVQPKDL